MIPRYSHNRRAVIMTTKMTWWRTERLPTSYTQHQPRIPNETSQPSPQLTLPFQPHEDASASYRRVHAQISGNFCNTRPQPKQQLQSMAALANRLILTRFRLHRAGLNIDQYHTIQANHQAEQLQDNQPPENDGDAVQDRHDIDLDADNPVNNVDDVDEIAQANSAPPPADVENDAHNHADMDVDHDAIAHDALLRSLQGIHFSNYLVEI